MATEAGAKNEFPCSNGLVVFAGLLCAAGLSVAFYLTWLHYKVHTDPSFHSFCAMSDAFNCETVAESPYSVFLGIPVAVWGMFGYLFMFLTAAAGVGKHRAAGAYLALLTAAAFSVLVSIVLAVVSYCVICSFCVMCSATYGINGVLFLTLLWQARRHHLPFREAAADVFSYPRKHAAQSFCLLAGVAAICLFYPKYWVQKGSERQAEQHKGVTREGYQWTGAVAPVLTVVEFSDYLCPHCRRVHALQRALVSANQQKLRLVHRHFPLDSACNPMIKEPFHPGACVLARAAVCAGNENRFWEMNDLLYQTETLTGSTWEEKSEDAAKRIGLDLARFRLCLNSEETQKTVNEDIAEGLRLKLQGTPSFVVNGKVYLGTVDKSVYELYGISHR